MVPLAFNLSHADSDSAAVTVVTVALAMPVLVTTPAMMTPAVDYDDLFPAWLVHVTMRVTAAFDHHGLCFRRLDAHRSDEGECRTGGSNNQE
ncbi:MAG: hypothetical protein ABWZ64_07050 [Xanthobacteraceae bacterium]